MQQDILIRLKLAPDVTLVVSGFSDIKIWIAEQLVIGRLSPTVMR